MSNKYRSYCFLWEPSGHKLVDIISKTCNVGIISKSCRCNIMFIYLSLADQIACSICYNCDLNIGRSEIASHWRSWLWGYAYVASLVLGKNLLLQLESWEIWPGDEAIANGLDPRATSSSECNALAIYHRVIYTWISIPWSVHMGTLYTIELLCICWAYLLEVTSACIVDL